MLTVRPLPYNFLQITVNSIMFNEISNYYAYILSRETCPPMVSSFITLTAYGDTYLLVVTALFMFTTKGFLIIGGIQMAYRCDNHE